MIPLIFKVGGSGGEEEADGRGRTDGYLICMNIGAVDCLTWVTLVYHKLSPLDPRESQIKLSWYLKLELLEHRVPSASSCTALPCSPSPIFRI